MFCSKCGNELMEGATFCPQCGTKVVYEDGAQQSIDIPVPNTKGQQTSEAVPNTQQASTSNTVKVNGGLHKAAKIGRVLMWGSLLLLFLSSFVGLPIDPAILGVGVAIGIILSALGAKRPLSLSKIIELVVAGILLMVIAVSVMSSGGESDKYVQIVKEGTLDAYPQMTVGKAFDNYLNKPKWESGLSDNNERFVNVRGGILYYDKEAEIVVQFIVDEKSGLFQFNACEIDGIPQNNLIVWSLFETIYNGDSASAELGSQGVSNSALDVITIGETQSFDDEGFGNMEVTLDYAQFVDSYQNTLTGGYIYPGEDFVFLWTALTLKNIGTANATLPTAWSKIIYDGSYEFTSPSLVGDMSGLPPLSEPREVALVFKVPIAVLESDKSLALSINDIYGGSMLSYAVRPSDGSLENSSSEVISGESIVYSLDYKGHALANLLGSRREELDNIYGAPTGGTLVDGYLMYGSTEYHEYSDGEMYVIMSEETGTVAEISVMANATKLNGDAMDLTREEIKGLFGEPSYEDVDYDEYGEEYGYVVSYFPVEGEFYLSFWFPDMNTEAYDLTIGRYSEY